MAYCSRFRLWILLLTQATIGQCQSFTRIECDPREPNTIPYNSPNATRFPGVYYGANFVCGLTCPGKCDSSPAWRPTVTSAFKCQCAVVGGCNRNGPITGYEEHGDQFPRCDKVPYGNCRFQKKEFPFLTSYQAYRCKMYPNDWTIYYACCPKL